MTAALLLALTLTACTEPGTSAHGAQNGTATPSGTPAPLATFRSRHSDVVGIPTKGCRPDRPIPTHSTYQGMDLYSGGEQLQRVLQSIQEAGEGRFRAFHAGAEVAEDRGEGAVFRVPDAGYDAFIIATAGDVCLFLAEARFNHVTLDAFARRILADDDHWKAQGVDLTGVSGSNRGDGVTVYVTPADAADARIELPKRYGTQIPIRIEEREAFTAA
ncbi:hypothetical protein Cme02nite_58900 [Catellatospora methionotrophica]|uniref:Uncharacterized protein n=1 Tax=Catellatospora methionotrophica TaxID=121620 RepID=A0A8J3LAW1_9ACTN|nr:hypothetical protein [Catellatospora methionotrophica]GIG17558.1 hypothetical protein Cme02nite_58900 [Catellatospora methionotrophica]